MAYLREIAAVLEEGKSFLLTTHEDPDADGIGSMLALGKALLNQLRPRLRNLQIIKAEIAELAQISQLSDINIKIIISETSRAVFAIPSTYPKEKDYINGVSCNFLHEERPNPALKVFHAELKKKVDKNKREAGVFESLLVNKQGLITEGSKSNIFFIKEQRLFTAPDSLVLAGITRQKIIDICKNLNFPLRLQAIDYKNIANYHAAFLCGTSPGVLPIHKIEDISFQVNNHILQKVHQAYHQLMLL
jgi:branched-chain amino acid aminotransferase